MQNELTGALTGLADLFVDALLFPFGDPGGFAAGEITAHRERSVGQIQRILFARLIGFGLVGFCHFSCVSRPPRALPDSTGFVPP